MPTTNGNPGAGVETPSGKDAAYENFPVGSWLLPVALRPHIAKFYAFARAIDDIADSPELAAKEKVRRLDGFERALLDGAGGGGKDQAYQTAYRMRDSLTETPMENLWLLAGSGATLGAANITYNQKVKILRRLRALDADVVVVDVGAGVGYNALDFFELGAQRLVVTTPQVTSIHDAYSFLKGAVLRNLRHHSAHQA